MTLLDVDRVDHRRRFPSGVLRAHPGAFAVVLLAAVMGFAAVVLTGPYNVEFGDAHAYIAAAEAILDGDPYPRDDPKFFRPPLYPMFLALLWFAGPDSVFLAKLGNVALFAGAVALLYTLGWKMFRSRWVATVGAALWALNPFALETVTDIQSEPLATFLLAAAVLGLATAALAERVTAIALAIAGVALGLSALTRPTTLSVAFPLIVAGAAVAWRRDGLKDAAVTAATLVAGMVLVVAPWTIANYRATGGLLPVSNGAGYHLWVYNHPESIAIYERDFANPDEFDEFSRYLQEDLPIARIDQWHEEFGFRDLPPHERDSYWMDEALENMREHPTTTAKLWAYKLWAFWRPYLNPAAYADPVVAASALLLVPLYLFGAAGIALAVRRNIARPALIVLVVLFVSATIGHVVVSTMMRYRLPYVDPYLSVFAGAAVVAVAARSTGRSGSQSAAVE